MATFRYVSLLLFQPYLLGSDVGPLWSQRLEGTSVSMGCEIWTLWKGDENMQWGLLACPI